MGDQGTMVMVTDQQKVMQDPYFLSTNDGPGYVITTVKLKEENYEYWAKHVRNALRTKRKLGFINGTIPKPTDAAKLETWGVVNSMLVAWINNTIDPSLLSSISLIEEAKNLWDDLKLQFSVGNGARVQELKSEIANCKQKGDSVMIYFGRMKKLWDELAVYKPIRSCKCGELSAQLMQDHDEDRTHEFLMGLDANFGTARSNITSIEPLPKLSQVYQWIIREERHHSAIKKEETKADVLGFAVQAGFKPTRDGDGKVCKHCGKPGHDINDCYQVKGYPEWWGERGGRGGTRGRGRGGGIVGVYGRERGTYAPRNSQGEGITANTEIVTNLDVAVASHATTRTEFDCSALSQLTEEQWSEILSLVQPQKTEQPEKLNGPYQDGDWCG